MSSPGQGARHRIVTPESLVLELEVAPLGDRLGAFLLDLGIMLVVLFGLGLLGFLAAPGEMMVAFLVLALFLLRILYFIWFEIRWQGRTPGKRRAGLRVVDRRGGMLTAEATIARNLTREVEFFLPATLLSAPESAFGPSMPGWLSLLGLVWVVLFLVLPLLNRHRLRLGDLLAGTIVVVVPKNRLLADLAGREAAAGQPAAAPSHAFTREQLEIYGIYELQVLEDVLRRAGQPGGKEALSAVAERIQRRIGWTSELRPEPRRFLQEFYAAQRAHLEQRMLLGERRERKRGRSPTR